MREPTGLEVIVLPGKYCRSTLLRFRSVMAAAKAALMCVTSDACHDAFPPTKKLKYDRSGIVRPPWLVRLRSGRLTNPPASAVLEAPVLADRAAAARESARTTTFR